MMTCPALSKRQLLQWFAAAATATTAAATSLPLLAASDFPEITWEELIPSDWEPLKEFRDLQKYSTVPDTDPRVEKIYERMRKVWDEAPTIVALEGRKVRIPGYLVPLENSSKGISEFLLVPYFGACIHTPPPPANQIIHVRSDPPVKGLETMNAVWVNGTLGLERNQSDMGASGYHIAAARVEKYRSKKTK